MTTRALDVQTPLGPHAFLLIAFDGREQLSQLGELKLRLRGQDPDVGPEKMLGQNVTARLELYEDKARYFNGYVTSWRGVSEERTSVPGLRETKAYVYEATLHPWLWLLTRQSHARVFQNKTAPQIVEQVFRDYGGLASFKNMASASYPEREFCCQYRETDYAFIARLLEEEGIYWFVEHENGKHTIKLVDSSSSHEPYPGYDEVRFDREERSEHELLTHWWNSYEIQPGRVRVDDYDPLKPRTSLEAFADKPTPDPYGPDLRIFEYPGFYVQPADGEAYARKRLDELHSRFQVFEGSGHVRGLQAGCVFTLARHPVDAFNAKHLITSAAYHATGDAEVSGAAAGFEFECQITAIPAKQQYRPPRVTPKPLMAGPQTAVVVGPSGEEIYTDEYGRIKVQFRWDETGEANQDSSCWIRVAQTFAGNAYGTWALPRVGQEVVIDFLDGDVDRPIVIGSVYNGENKTPYQLPANKTQWGLKSRSSKGGAAANFNELRFEDKMGSEEIFLRAQKDQNLITQNDRNESVGGKSNLNVTNDVMEKFGADMHHDVEGDEMVKTGGGMNVTVGDAWQGTMGSKFAVDASQEVHIKAGMTLVLEAGTQLSLKVGGNFIDINPGGVFISGTMVMVNSGGSAGSGSGSSPQAPKSADAPADSQGGTDSPISQKAQALKAARESSTPFCEICNA